MKFKIKASFLLAVLLIVSLFVGCSGPKSDPNKNDKDMTTEERKAAAEYIVDLLEGNLVKDIASTLAEEGEEDAVKGLEITANDLASEEKLTLTLSLTDYKYGAANTEVDGTLTIIFTGKTADKAFNASAYEMDSNGLTFGAGEDAMLLSLTDVKGAFAPKTGSANTNLAFDVADGAITGIATTSSSNVIFATPTEGSVKMDGRHAIEIEKLIPSELTGTNLTTIQTIVKAVFEKLENKTAIGKITSASYDVNYDFKYTSETNWTLTVTADKKKADEHDIEFTLTPSSKTVDVLMEGKLYTVAYSTITSGADLPKDSQWDITVRLAKHKDTNKADGFNDHSNYMFVGEPTYSNGVITVSANVNGMASYASTEGKGDGKWFALLIGTGFNDIKTVSYGSGTDTPTELGDKDINDRNAMETVSGASAASDEFVLWLKADELAKEGTAKSFTLSHADEEEDVKVTIKFEDTSSDIKDETLSVGARLAKHSGAGGFNDHENYNLIDSVVATSTQEDPSKVTIKVTTVDFKDEDNSTSSDSPFEKFESTEKGQGTHEWFSILVSTGISDIKSVTYKSGDNTAAAFTNDDICDRNDMRAVEKVDGSDYPADDEFVLWLKADELRTQGEDKKTFTLSLAPEASTTAAKADNTITVTIDYVEVNSSTDAGGDSTSQEQ